MQGFQSLILFATGCVLADAAEIGQKDGNSCLASSQWRDLWKRIDKMNDGLNSGCHFMERGNLCIPEEMLRPIFANPSAIVQVLHETAKLFNRTDAPFPNVCCFLYDIDQAHEDLKNCLDLNIDVSFHHGTVTECFQHLHTFLNSHLDPCAWATAARDSIVILQHLEQQFIK